MTMLTIVRRRSLLAIVGVFAVAVMLSGCPSATNKEKAGKPPKKTEAGRRGQPEPSRRRAQRPGRRLPAEREAEKPPAAGAKGCQDRAAGREVDPGRGADRRKAARSRPAAGRTSPKDLKRLDPEQPVWIDLTRQAGRAPGRGLQGRISGCPLEFFATYSNRSYEAVVAVNVTPSIVHAGLLAVGAKPGHPARFQPKFEPPTGTEVAIEVRWKDAQGKVQSCPAQHWIRNIKTGKELDANWVFAGSMFVTDEAAGKKYLPGRFRRIDLRAEPAHRDARLADCKVTGRSRSGRSRRLRSICRRRHAGNAAAEADSFGQARRAGRKGRPPRPNTRRPRRRPSRRPSRGWRWSDQGEYSQSWETAAGYLKNRRREARLRQVAQRREKAAGKSRLQATRIETVHHEPARTRPTASTSSCKYKTSFEHRKSAIETVTPMLDKDKKWRVSGYYIK